MGAFSDDEGIVLNAGAEIGRGIGAGSRLPLAHDRKAAKEADMGALRGVGDQLLHRRIIRPRDNPRSVLQIHQYDIAAALLEARERPAFISAVRALDRALMSGFYAIPLFNAGEQWIARWNRIERPERTSLTGYLPETWWQKPDPQPK